MLSQPIALDDVVDVWRPHLTAYTDFIGYSTLGHMYLHNPQTQHFAVLHPLQAGIKDYGPYATVAEFRETILEDPYFVQVILLSEHVQKIADRLGPLEPGEVYIPVPYPFLGGSGEPETYDKGQLVTFVEIVGQMLIGAPAAAGEAGGAQGGQA